MNWKELLNVAWPIITAICATLLGVNYNEVSVSGVASPPQSIGMGALTIGTGVGLLMSIITNWKKAGGKIDGIVKAEEVSAVVNTVAPQYKNITDRLAPEAAILANLIGNYIRDKMGNGKPLNVLSGTHAGMDHNNRAFVWSLVDSLASILQGDPQSEDAMAVVRERLDMLFFPETPKNGQTGQSLMVPSV